MRRDSFALAKQTVFGTPVTVWEQYPPVASVDVKDVGEQIIADETTGTRFPARLERGVKGWTIGAKGSARPQSLPKILAGFLGTPTKTNPFGGEATAYSYLFDPVPNDPALHTLLATMKDPATPIVGQFSDAIGSALTLSCDPSGFLSFEANYFAASYVAGALPTPVLDVTKRWTFDQVVARVSIDGGAETIIPVAAFSLGYSNNEDRDSKALGQRGLYDLAAGVGEAQLQFTPKANLSTEFARALADDPNAVKVRITATGATIGAGGTNFIFEVIVYLCEYIEAPAGIDATKRLNAIPVTARAAYDTTSGKFITVQVVNTTNNAA